MVLVSICDPVVYEFFCTFSSSDLPASTAFLSIKFQIFSNQWLNRFFVSNLCCTSLEPPHLVSQNSSIAEFSEQQLCTSVNLFFWVHNPWWGPFLSILFRKDAKLSLWCSYSVSLIISVFLPLYTDSLYPLYPSGLQGQRTHKLQGCSHPQNGWSTEGCSLCHRNGLNNPLWLLHV